MAVVYSLSLLFVAFVALQWRPVISQPRLPHLDDPQCFNGSRVQCGTPKTISAASCAAAGCCWDTSNEPSCFFPIPVYIVQSVTKSIYGVKMILKNQFDKGGPRQVAAPISPLQLEVTRETSSRLHVKITDPNNKRYEVPEDILPVPPHPKIPMKVYGYDFEYAGEGEQFHLVITRKKPYQVLFNTSSIGFIYSDNLLMIGTNLPANYNIYGFGEHKTPLKLKPGSSYTLWSYDIPTPEHVNLYGSHPFYMELQDGYAHGVFLRNSNGMDVMLDQTSLTYRVIGGVLDFYFFVGNNGLPDEVINDYHEVIGRPAMPPYWALGYHQCRWGYKKLQDVKDILTNFTNAKMPLDTLWMDIDYMYRYTDFTTDPVNFPSSDMKEFLVDVHKSGKHFVVILDPAISNQMHEYKPYEDGVSMDVFIKDSKGKDFVGKVWPGLTVFPDFLNPTTAKYWEKQIATFLFEVPVDGLWIDMNEPSNFCNGSCNSFQSTQELQPSNQTVFGILNPPYNLNNQDDHFPLNDKTLDMDCKQYGGHSFYDTHNLYGFTEAIATRKALLSVNPDKRPFVLSRSTFPGSGVHTAHWLGDNTATSEDMYYSIPGMLNFQMFGIPLVGADICGFGGDTTEELCGRWMSLGAFYPFMRNHNINTGRPQEPYRWSSVAAISQKFLSIRYSLLPYIYTFFYRTTVGSSIDKDVLAPSSMVVMPLFMEFPKDSNCLSIDDQFLFGSALLISPQLKLGDEGKKLLLYLPPAKWYDWFTYEAVSDRGELSISVDTPLEHLPIYIRGGYIIPMQEPALTTTQSRNNPYSLLVALPSTDDTAYGDLYLDDGETYNTKEYTYMTFSYKEKHLLGRAYGSNYASKHLLPLLTEVTIIGITGDPKSVTVNSKPARFSCTTVGENVTKVLRVALESIPIGTNFDLDWS